MTDYPIFNVFAPTPCTCMSECESTCNKLATTYTVTFSELPWNLPLEWVFTAGQTGEWFPNSNYPFPIYKLTDGEYEDDPDGEMAGLCYAVSVAAEGAGEYCLVRHWRRVLTGAENETQCGILKYTRPMAVYGNVWFTMGSNSTTANQCDADNRIRVGLGVCFLSSLPTCEYDPETTEGVGHELAPLELGPDWDCENLPEGLEDWCENDLGVGWEDEYIPQQCTPPGDIIGIGEQPPWTEVTDFRIYALWISDIDNCNAFLVEDIPLTISPTYVYCSDCFIGGEWCQAGWTHELASGTTVTVSTA